MRPARFYVSWNIYQRKRKLKMKKLIAIVLALVLCLSLAACEKKDTGEANNQDAVTQTPEKNLEEGKNLITGYKSGDVTLAQYTGLTYKPLSTEVTDQEVDEKFSQYVDSYKSKKEVTDRDDAQDGDIVDIDFKGYKDGEEFDGGSGNYPNLVIGSNAFIEGFEAGLIGHKKGESFNVACTLSENHANAELAGADVVFEVTIKGIYKYEIPEGTDAFVAEKTSGKYETVAAYKDNIRAQLRSEKEEEAELQKQYDLVQKLIDSCTYNCDIEAEIQRGEQSLKNYNDQAIMSAYGMDAVGYYSTYLGMTEEQYNQMIRAQAELSVRYEFVRSAIVEAERFQVTDEEIEELGTRQMKEYAYASLDDFYKKIEELNGVDAKTYIGEQVKLNKAADLIFDTAIPEE